MFTAILTFFGSAAARVAIGKLFDFIEKWQDSKTELARMELQARLDAAAHDRNLALLVKQHELGVKLVEAKSDADTAAALLDAFQEAVRATRDKSGILWLDAWNGAIRPFLATLACGLWVAALWQQGGALTPWDRDLISMALGIFVGGRIAATGR